jgi:hypothetical protein
MCPFQFNIYLKFYRRAVFLAMALEPKQLSFNAVTGQNWEQHK